MHSCDHRSDFQCPACAQDQVDHERMVEARGAANPQTIREHLDETVRLLRATRVVGSDEVDALRGCIEDALDEAVAALDLLGQSKRAGLHHTSTYRLVPDPAPRGDAEPEDHSDLPPDLLRLLRSGVLIRQDARVFELISEWQNAPSNTASASLGVGVTEQWLKDHQEAQKTRFTGSRRAPRGDADA